jgi:hypothetical protein
MANEDFLRQAVRRSAEKMSDSALFLALFTKDYERDAVAVLQLGLAVLLDKPMGFMVQKGTPIPENVRRMARAIVEYEHVDDVGVATETLLRDLKAQGLLPPDGDTPPPKLASEGR